MHPSEYGVMSQCERDHWWYYGLHSLVVDMLSRHVNISENPLILDAGCGTGGFLVKYQTCNASLIGMEPSGNAYPYLLKTGIKNLVKADMLRIPFNLGSFDAIVSLDVLCVFQDKEVSSAIRELVRSMKPDGYLILNLPAYSWMMSGHDHFVGNKSRFTVSAISEELSKAGLMIKYQGYRNTVLFPIVVVVRFFNRLKSILFKEYRQPIESNVKMTAGWLNWILARILIIENHFILREWRFRYGLSVFIVAQKKGSEVEFRG